MTTQEQPKAVISPSRSPGFKAALTLGQGLPEKRNGMNCYHYWGHALSSGSYVHPVTGQAFDITGGDLDDYLKNFAKMSAAGVEPPIVEDHKETADKSLGFIVGMKRDGNDLWELHQFLGEDARDKGLRNLISVRIDKEMRDGKGNRYENVIRHSAATPIPVIPNQKGFFAASGVQSDEEPIVLMLNATANTGVNMKMTPEELQQVRKCMSYQGDDMTPDNALSMLLSHVSTLNTKTLSAAEDSNKVKTLSASLTEKDTKIVELEKKLNPNPPDAEILRDRRDIMLSRVDIAVEKGDMPKSVADKLKAAVGSAEKPSIFMLSRAEDLNSRPVEYVLSLFDGSKLGAKMIEKSGIQTLSREVPDGDGGDKGNEKDPQLELLKTQVAAYAPAKA